VESCKHDSGELITVKCEQYFDLPRETFIVKKLTAFRTSAIKEIFYSRHDQGKMKLSFWNLTRFFRKCRLSLYGPKFCKFNQN
jgi:hypothetical protein